jgi:Tol biopolymer transport system component
MPSLGTRLLRTRCLARLSATIGLLAAGLVGAAASAAADGPSPSSGGSPDAAKGSSAALLRELRNVPYKIVFETFRQGNWDLYMVRADGSGAVNLTRTPQQNELYPHVSPDGTKISFVADEGEGEKKSRNVYFMNLDGSGRTPAATNAREPFWSPDGKAIVYLKGEFDRFTLTDYASKGLFLYDVATGKHAPHPNATLHHLYNVCATGDGRWFVATVHAGMGEGHAILAIEAAGPKVFNLRIPGCRPDISADGKRIAWGCDDYTLRVGELDFSGPEPKVVRQRDVIKSEKPIETYHVDWSPDGKYLAFSRGPTRKTLGPAPEMIGVRAPQWDICVADAEAANRFVAITTDGQSNKEPDWVPAAPPGKKD